MDERERNPFAMVDHDGRKIQAMRAPEGTVRWSTDQINTFVCVANRMKEPLRAEGALVIEGVLWTPEPGARIELGEPNRDAIVLGVKYKLYGGQLSAFVYVTDPETAEEP